MDYDAIKEAIRVAVRDAIGLSDTNASGRASSAVLWSKTREAGGFRPAVRVDLILRSPVGLGRDETRHEYDADTDENTATQCGLRMLNVSIRIQSYDHTGATEAVGTLAGRLRTRLYRESILVALAAADVALHEIRPTVEQDYTEDDREVSLAIVDVVFSAPENDVDDNATASDYIAGVTLSTENETDGDPDLLLGEDGEPHATQIVEVIGTPP
jgi:hypothetical protein